ncbi:anti-sigma factor [Noviherbaspirillum cavernae]|uniref:Anti-sigma factor n=1 Tax=Noviherbaspirillum cavernae TaxID=2320862 RepID=A0A418X486_9BURK|nr:anti-sigma factor [Noviherbaspirillum cavernae]RJG07298.1 anti-sigma factor [Noviherbaspirillum cavernae]
MTTPSIGEADLHAYVDGQLDAARRAEVEAYLAAHPETAAQVQELRGQTQALHAAYDGVLNEPIPLRLTNVLQARSWPRGLAAGMAWLACGLVAGWFAHPLLSPATVTPVAFAKEAMAAHVLYVSEKRHPVEVPAEQEAHLVAWLSKRLDAPIRAPDLNAQGFSLLGGRLLPGDDAPLAQLMYQSASGERLTLTVKRATQSDRETGFKVMEMPGTSVFYWIDRDYGYALSGGIDKSRLLAVARAVDGQLRGERN